MGFFDYVLRTKRTMNPTLLDEPLATSHPDFAKMVEESLGRGENLIVLVRYAAAGGLKDWYLPRSMDDFGAALSRMKPKDSISVFFDAAMPIRGQADQSALDQALDYFRALPDKSATFDIYKGLDVIRLGIPGFEIPCSHGPHWLETEAQIGTWLRENEGAPIAVGQLRFWEGNGERVVTAYVPDQDGLVRPSSY